MSVDMYGCVSVGNYNLRKALDEIYDEFGKSPVVESFCKDFYKPRTHKEVEEIYYIISTKEWHNSSIDKILFSLETAIKDRREDEDLNAIGWFSY